MKYNISEETRKKMSESAIRRCTPEWRKAQSDRLATRLDTDRIRQLYEAGHTQEEIAQMLGTTQKVIWKHMKRHGIKARVAAKRNQFGDRNHAWKGDNAKYQAMHLRLESRFGKASARGCSVCGTTDPSLSYDWANLTGNYGDINDYAPMCRSCHRRYDMSRRKKVV